MEYFRKREVLKAETLFGAAERAVKRDEERRDERIAEDNMVDRKPSVTCRPLENPHHPIGCVNTRAMHLPRGISHASSLSARFKPFQLEPGALKVYSDFSVPEARDQTNIQPAAVIMPGWRSGSAFHL